MFELSSYTGTRVAEEVENKFGDAGNVQITKPMILTWINNGIRSIAADHTLVEGSASANLLAGQNVYDLGVLFASARMKSYEVVTISGRPLKLVTFGEYQGIIASNDLTAHTGTPTVGNVRGSTLTLWPVPAETVTNGITIYYSAYPPDLEALEGKLPLPDRLYNALVDYVYAQALELDENFEGAQIKLAHHEAGVRREFERDRISPTDFYPTITPDPYDEDAGYF